MAGDPGQPPGGDGPVTTTLSVLRLLRDADRPGAPATASQRRYLRDGLPAVYREGDFGMRFLEALEQTLDPVVALLDSLPAHFDPKLAPAPLLDLASGWIGIEVDESWPLEQRRALLRRFGDLSRRRGTRAGLELLLQLAFPDLPLRVEDSGRVAYAEGPEGLPEPPEPGFVVYCDAPVDDEQAQRIAGLIDAARPVHVGYRLRVRRSGESS